MSHEFHSLTVERINRETPDSVSVFFTIPDDLATAFQYQAGQYLTLKFVLNGTEVRRAYSICTSPLDKALAINVKRVSGGLVSNHINDQLKAGDVVEVMVPEGNFKIDFQPNASRDLYFLAAGSGITPIISIIRTALEEEPKSQCYLLYGNKNEDSVIFADELKMIEEKYQGQFFLKETLSKPKRTKQGGLAGLFSKGKESWTGWKGRIDGKKIDQFLDEYASQNEAHYFVCGPGAMIDTLIDHLENKGIDNKHLHKEHFISSAPKGIAVSNGSASSVAVQLTGKEFVISVPPEKTILDVLIDEGYDPPYSCTSGACSTCLAKLIKGDVTMDVCYALDDDEVKNGFILTCQSRAQSEEVELTFDT